MLSSWTVEIRNRTDLVQMQCSKAWAKYYQKTLTKVKHIVSTLNQHLLIYQLNQLKCYRDETAWSKIGDFSFFHSFSIFAFYCFSSFCSKTSKNISVRKCLAKKKSSSNCSKNWLRVFETISAKKVYNFKMIFWLCSELIRPVLVLV